MIERVNWRDFRPSLLAPVLLALFLGLFGEPGPAHAKELFYQNRAGIAIQGYDPVAYFTEGKAVKGSDAFAYRWLGATWHFASAEHRDLFTADPIKYAPRYGGYCTSGIVKRDIHGTNPNFWRMVDGKLYLNGSQFALQRWLDSDPEAVEKADAEWELLKADLTE